MQAQQKVESTRLEIAEALVVALQAGDDQQADQLIGELAGQTDPDLFQEVGRLTRELHEAINGFLLDDRLSSLTMEEIPDAKERLNYVITMTEQSADRTLTAVEQSLPLIEVMEKDAAKLLEEWNKLRARLLQKSDFVELSNSLVSFLDKAKEDSSTLHSNLSDVLMAQDFQDLTGQIIRKVIDLVRDVEEKLVMLIRITGGKMDKKMKGSDPTELAGPAVPGVDEGNQVTSQDGVDDLLSSLGF